MEVDINTPVVLVIQKGCRGGGVAINYGKKLVF